MERNAFSRGGALDGNTHPRESNATIFAASPLRPQAAYINYNPNGFEPDDQDDPSDYDLQEAFATYIDETGGLGHRNDQLQYGLDREQFSNVDREPEHNIGTDLLMGDADIHGNHYYYKDFNGNAAEAVPHIDQNTPQYAGSGVPGPGHNGPQSVVSMTEKHPLDEAPGLDDDYQSESGEHDEDEDVLGAIFQEAEAACFDNHPLQDVLLPDITFNIADLDSPPGVESLDQYIATKRNEGYFQDRWGIDKESAGFLATVMRETKEDETSEMRYYISEPWHDLKVEAPAIRSDPATDVRKILKRNEIHMTSKGMEAFRLNADNDEALEWGAKNLALPARIDKELATEKWHVDAETMIFMKATLADDGSSLEDWARQELERKIIRKASPKLLPLSSSLSPMRLPSPVANIELTSTPEDPTIREAARLRGRIAACEAEEAREDIDAGMKDVEDFLIDDLGPALTSTPVRKKGKRLQDLKVSSPLLPAEMSESSEPPSKKTKTVAFAEELKMAIPQLPPVDEMTDPELGAQEAFTAMGALLEPYARPALDNIANEELCEADTIGRVPIPPISPVKAVSPWDEPHDLRSTLCEEVTCKESKWSGVSKLEKSLPWAPFSSRLAKIRPEGDFDDGSCVMYLKELRLDEEFDMQRFVWKPEGLRILDVDEDEEDEVQAVSWPVGEDEQDDSAGQDLMAHSQHGNRAQPSQSWASGPPPTVAPVITEGVPKTTQSVSRPQARRTAAAPLTKPVTAADPFLPETGFSYILKSIPRSDSFHERLDASPGNWRSLDIGELLKQRKAQLDQGVSAKPQQMEQGNARQQPKQREAAARTSALQGTTDAREHFSQFLHLNGRPITPAVPKATRGDGEHGSRGNESPVVAEQTFEAKSSNPPRANVNIPVPVIENREQPFQVILSASVTSNHFMIRKLQELLPSLEMITRDCIVQAREADITLSTSTGLMFTNIQKLKQKPLPGQRDFYGIREQVAVAALRYERLIVLVSEGKQTFGEDMLEVSGLDERNANALCDFNGECDLLDAEVTVQYIPGGDEQLIQWLAASISRHAVSVERFTLLQDETMWEQFLRRAGLNAYAAQFILGELKSPSSDHVADAADAEHDGLFGLPAFICMTEEARVQRFGPLIGGEVMLRRASRATDGRWPSLGNVR
ncbi:hypothetical protein Slin15195_G102670 [Septoria linicola]|uniref:Uncharacterized protein n=1 Tax=Septoria linicola TaxID=215465 RepID=A0A9Q9B116_9PEZI|nr:hypothetical protein Slin14017_G065670 [Septoria linicola]USW56948.1 hypothetical protein Slin15195_G102670 [Septoria linicola]